MVIEVRLFGDLRRFVPSATTGAVTVDVPDGITVIELLNEMEIDPNEVHTVFVNHAESKLQRVLFDGDIVVLVPKT